MNQTATISRPARTATNRSQSPPPTDVSVQSGTSENNAKKIKLLMLKGLPASGKSTYAKELVSKGWKRINKDDLRAMIDNKKWSKSNERGIVECRNAFIRLYLNSGYHVVVDDTNFAPSHSLNLQAIAEECGAVYAEEFIDTPLEECIDRDLKRCDSVGEKVIRQMYDQYLRPEVPEQDQSLPPAIICDIDGTIAHMDGHRSPYDWDKVHLDRPDYAIIEILYRLNHNYNIIIVSGRDSICREATEQWLSDYEVPYEYLYMRHEEDKRKDVIVKDEIYHKYINGEFYVHFVLDDRDQVVDMWRAKGLKCLQVAPGNF